MSTTPVVLEPAAAEFAAATANPPYLFDLAPAEGRKAVDEVQSGDVALPPAEVEQLTIPAGDGTVGIHVVTPPDAAATPPVILYTHGAGWVFGNFHTHERLVRELAAGTGAAVVFPDYSLSPEVRYPVALEEVYATLAWIATQERFDTTRIAVAGDSVGGNLTAALTLLNKERGATQIAGQVLFYPVTDASFDTDSYHQFAEGYFLRRDGMQWFWDQYTTDPAQRAEITASPLRASTDQLSGLPRALVITGEADVLRDEGEAYARKLREAGVDVTAIRYEGIIHDFVMVNAMRGSNAAEAAIAQAIRFLQGVLV